MTENSVTFRLDSPQGDQGFPGNAVVRVTYAITGGDTLSIRYHGVCDRDTVFNLTNHSYFNLAGQENGHLAMGQELTLPARFFNPDDSECIPTGELCPVAGTPMDFRVPKALGRDIGADFEPLRLQGGYDHNFEVFCAPAPFSVTRFPAGVWRCPPTAPASRSIPQTLPREREREASAIRPGAPWPWRPSFIPIP